MRQALQDNKVTLQDLVDVVMLESATSLVGENVYNFIDLEGFAEKEKRDKEIKQLTELLKSVKDKEERKRLLSRLKELTTSG